MKAVIKGGNSAGMLRLNLDNGEGIYGLSKTVMAHSGAIAISNRQDGGLLSKLARKFSGGHFLYQEIRATRDDQWIMLSPDMPGSITSIDLHDGNGLIADEQAFLSATSLVQIGRKVTAMENIGSQIISTVSFSGDGTVFLNACGVVEMLIILPEQEIFISTAHLIAWEQNLLLQKTVDNMTKIKGSGRVWLQTRTPDSLLHYQNNLPSGKK